MNGRTSATELSALPATELAARLGRRELGAAELLEACLERIETREPEIHAWTIVDAEAARERARMLDHGPVLGPLHGLPIAVKDLIDTAALPTAYGSPIYAGHRPVADAACVAAAQAAGAIVLGKTVTTEFAMFTPGPTVNPHAAAHTPGGSSSGSAAAVAASMVPLAFGTQTLGSVVRPASFCGIVGYKPSFGTIERAGVKLIAESLDTLGVFARTVPDAALFVAAIADRAGDLRELPAVPEPLRIGLCRTHEWAEAQAETRAALDEAARRLASAGAEIFDIELPESFAELRRANEHIFGYEIARRLAPERRTHSAALSPRLLELLEAGERVDAADYERAQARVRDGRRAFPEIMGSCDVLLTPSAPGAAPAGLDSTGSPVMNRLWTLLGVPCVNVPGLSAPSGLPVGLQVVGRFGDDARVLAAADRLHRRLAGAG